MAYFVDIITAVKGLAFPYTPLRVGEILAFFLQKIGFVSNFALRNKYQKYICVKQLREMFKEKKKHKYQKMFSCLWRHAASYRVVLGVLSVNTMK